MKNHIPILTALVVTLVVASCKESTETRAGTSIGESAYNATAGAIDYVLFEVDNANPELNEVLFEGEIPLLQTLLRGPCIVYTKNTAFYYRDNDSTPLVFRGKGFLERDPRDFRGVKDKYVAYKVSNVALAHN